MALYRKYRPATFAEVVGQEHVTEPLSTALEAGRINHAYLFSGPRGCGKTSSARILARSLNCVEGPTATPCGTCRSCVALGPGGPGNLDVIELDAASHGGVDDTRDLRDKAFYAPAESRYRVFIIDEAHMVTSAGFNALLKIVEEPPEHLIFIFATTEPEKVLPTIRSRTHHYPFRLLPPSVMRGLLEKICAQETVQVEAPVYPLVIRAGGGSPRDSLSVLDQLLAGAGDEGVTYARALALLGVTDVALIDDAVDALAAADASALFGTVDRVMEAGHDPRRFATDLLERVRDLILLEAVLDAGERGLVDAPGDMLERMREEVAHIGPATLTRYAEVLHAGLGEMRGATAPRLLLEVMCARMLLPAASEAESAVLQRLERLERGVAVNPPAARSAGSGDAGAAAAAVPGVPGTAAAPAAPAENPSGPVYQRPSQRKAAADETATPARPATPPQQSAPPQPAAAPAPAAPAPVAPAREVSAPETSAAAAESAAAEQQPAAAQPAPAQPAAAEPVDERPAVPAEVPEPVAEPAADLQPAAGGPEPAAEGPDAAAVRAAWSEVRARVRQASRALEVMLSGAVVRSVSGQVLTMSHDSAPLAKRLAEPHNLEVVRGALEDVFGVDWQVQFEVGSGPAPAGGAGAPAGRQGQARTQPKSPPRYQRPSRAAKPADDDAAQSRSQSPGVSGPEVPPPDEPDLPDDPYDHMGSPPVDTAEDEEAMLAEAAADTGRPVERRDPHEASIELVRDELGGVVIDG
ncbi:DNA polymerase III subunit gamma and tau [Rhodococcus sp. D2-41]|uniref:DNA polymerase III subunit gamma and tau n=1 Tax=Speluncibacter jeojiensis TaxID=2710754 RepID=UPI00240F81B1|nr:DNA polymerase III subunit gamma and tau [Rhodococcus sp. D2-41]MDG3009516.1 DNA polymerase III subunit gamma and tau [Rhodococcus sp. D2-41]